ERELNVRNRPFRDGDRLKPHGEVSFRTSLFLHITRSPRPVAGTSMPSALAVLRLTTSSTLVDRWTGRSAVRPTYEKRSRPMADDAEMTLIPSNTEPATGSAAAEPPKQDTTNIFGRFKKKLLFAEETVVFFKHLSILGLVGGVIGTAVGSYFQYVSWREEQNIARYKEDFAAATAVFGDVASTVSTAVNLQQIGDAVDAGVDKNDDAFPTKTARDTYKSYLDARNALRERIDALARKMEIYVDWPSDRNRDPTVQRSADPLNSHSLGEYDFDCAKYLPNSTSIETLKVDPIPK